MKILRVKVLGVLLGAASMAWLSGAPVAEAQNRVEGQTLVTILPRQGTPAPPVTQSDLSVKLNGQQAAVTSWRPYPKDSKVELVLLIDRNGSSNLARQFGDIEAFVKALPPNVWMAFAYMQNGQSLFPASASNQSPFSNQPLETLKGLHLPGGMPGGSASPYFCLSDLAKHWPSKDPEARRIVLAITDGVDPYHLEPDSDDPYMQAAIRDAVQARMVVYSIYWQSLWHRPAPGIDFSFIGQNLMAQMVAGTGGKNFYQGMMNPVSFTSYFEELTRRLENQYELKFAATTRDKSGLESLKLKLRVANAEVTAPQSVWTTATEK